MTTEGEVQNMNLVPKSRRLLGRDEILAQKDNLQIREIPVPEWGGSVRMRELTSKERTKIELSLIRQQKGGGATPSANMDAYPLLRGRVLAHCLIDEANHPLFSEADIRALAELGSGPVERLFEIAQAMSGLSKADVESLVGESATAPNGDSHFA